MVFCVVTSDGDMLLFIFPHGLRLGSLDQVPGEGSAFLDHCCSSTRIALALNNQ